MANLSGYSCTLTVGSFDGATIKDITVTINGNMIDTGDLTSQWNTYAQGIHDWEVTGTKAYASESFLTLMHGSVSASVAVAIKNRTGSTLFGGVGFVTKGAANFSKAAAATESITITGKGAPTTPA
jgi:hypothetical protein